MVAVTANLKIGITEVNKDSLRMFTLGEKKKKSQFMHGNTGKNIYLACIP